MIKILSKHTDEFGEVLIGSEGAPEEARYAYEFADVFRKSGINPIVVTGVTRHGQKGILVGVLNMDKPSDKANFIIGSLRKAGFNPTIIQFEPPTGSPYDYDIFIGSQ